MDKVYFMVEYIILLAKYLAGIKWCKTNDKIRRK